MNLKVKEDHKNDLFFDDEKRSSFENYTNNDFGFYIVDEISLEGLDGITIEAFWKRILTRLEYPVTINNDLKEIIWRLICAHEDIQFYKLQEPRGVLDIYDRYKYFNSDIGVVMEMAYQMPEIYPFAMVTNPAVQGSSATFNTRTDVTSEVRNLSLKDAEKNYGRTLVMVASQKLRHNALVDEVTDPIVELQNMEYCVLEQIGRSRKHGELTQGNMSITVHFNIDPKSTFHYKKRLMHNNLIGKQFFYIKSAITEQNKTGRLLHLKRFFHIVKPKRLLVSEQIVNLIKSKPNYRLEYGELKRVFAENRCTVLKVVKSQQFRKFVKTDCLYPYRELYPNARKSEYLRKSQPIEKFIKCLEIVNPYVNLSAQWSNDQEDSDKEEDDSEEEMIGNKIYNMECFKEVYYHIHSKQGCTMQDIEKLMGVDNKAVRMAMKKLIAKNVLDIKKYDRGKQRHLMYYAKHSEDKEASTSQDPDPPKPSGHAISRIKERQRAAREKLGQNLVVQEESLPEFDFPKVIDLDPPHLDCSLFVKVSVLNTNWSDSYIRAHFIGTTRGNIFKLNTKFVQTIRSFEINNLLGLINSELILPPIKANLSVFYVSKQDVNHVTKLILLKAALEEITIQEEALCRLSRKRKHPTNTSLPILSDDREKVRTMDKNLQYMGDNPISVFTEYDDNVSVEIYASTPPESFCYDSVYPQCRDLSERVLSRIQKILNYVHEKRVFEEVFKMLKIIQDEEVKEGYEKKIDRKSLARLLSKLVKEGYIKIYKVIMSNEKITKTQAFICHPSITYNNSIIQSAYQQLKWKHFIGNQKKSVRPNVPSVQKTLETKIKEADKSPFTESDVMNSISDLREMNKMKHVQLKRNYNRYIGKVYGFKPKFIRMRILHEFLFHLIYCYDKRTEPLVNSEVKELFDSYRIDLTDVELEEMPKIYCKEISWKMFLPPLPRHKGWNEGWALVCDIILRLPVSVLCKIHNVQFDLPEITNILSHPIKRFYLVKDLPETIRNAVLYKRKYLFDIHEIMSRLAYCGLLQFGPQKYKEKDQVFIYLNRRATLLDTTTSEPAYHKVALKEYKTLAFFFNEQTDLDNYWYNIYGISLSTKLNAKHSGQLVTLVDVTARPELLYAVASKTQEEAIEDDDGKIPGDRRGAAGLDSSLWAHIMRNWFWGRLKLKTKATKSKPPLSVMGLRKEKLEKILPRNLPFNELQTASGHKVYLPETRRENKLKTVRKVIQMPTKTSRINQRIIRKIPNKKKSKARQYYDHTDKVILKVIGLKTRVRWTEREDQALLLCKVAGLLVNPNSSRKQLVSYTVMRDVIHRICPESKNKTSRACQRRLKFHLSDSYNDVENCISCFLKLKHISKNFSVLVNYLLKHKTSDNTCVRLKDSEINAAFVILMSYLVQHQQEVENVLKGVAINVNYLAEDNLKNIHENLVELDESLLKFKDVVDENDIQKEVLKTVIHSSLESKESGWTLQLFKIYQKYSDNVIREAVMDLKNNQTIALKKFNKKKPKIRWHTPFHLSNVYVFSQSSTFSVTTAIETFKTFLDIKENKKFLDFSQDTVAAKKYGQLLGLNEFFSFWDKFSLKFFLPQNTVILNPHIKDYSELVHELAVRWQMTLKKMSQDSVDNDLEPETENETYKHKTSDSGIYSGIKESGPSSSQVNLKHPKRLESDDSIDNPLDLTVETGNLETIDRLKTWVTDCMETERERRSPSPEFMDEEKFGCELSEAAGDVNMTCETDEINVEDVEPERSGSTTKKSTRDEIPTLDEIKEGMMQITPQNGKRKIPYITDLSSLLNKDTFADLNTDEKKLEHLKNHFITQYALLEDVIIDEQEQMRDFYLVKYLQQSTKNKEIWKKLQSEIIIKPPSEALVYEALDVSDFALVDAIIAFVQEKKEFGVTGPQIKEHFKQMEKHCSLERILILLTENRVLLRTGICTVTFVHFSFHSLWLIETFALSNDERTFLEEKTIDHDKDVRNNVERHLNQKGCIRVKVAPWTKVDGTLNEESLKTWLCNIMSHCLDHPGTAFAKVCEKFCHVKPMDIFRLAEILEELGCLEIYVYETEKEADLFSTWELPRERNATFLDNFNDMYLAVNNISMTKMGSFFCDYEE